jgi:glycosyltransferase involved in cell wall biosynthesis
VSDAPAMPGPFASPAMPGLFLDLQATQSAAYADRGIARYATELAAALLRAGAPVAGLALNPLLSDPRRLPDALAGSPLLVRNTRATFEAARDAAPGPLAYVVLSPMEDQLPTAAVIPPWADEADALVMVGYDVIPLVFADRYLAARQTREPYLGRLAHLARADLVLAISEHTRRDLVAHVRLDPSRVVNIGGGVSPSFGPPGPGDDPTAEVRRARPAIDKPFVLTVAGWEWRKNTETLIEAWARVPRPLRDAHRLVVACSVPPEGERAWRDAARRAGLADDDVVITGFVDDALLLALYRATRLFVFPSRYEGYGLPVAEAARCGAVCITSDRASLPEILDDLTSTFPAEDAIAMADAIERALVDGAHRDHLAASAAAAAEVHTWERVASRAIAALGALGALGGAATGPPRRVLRRPRLHIVGPFPPAESGVAVYNDRVVAALAERRPDIDVTLLAEEVPAGSWTPRRHGARVMPVAAYGTHVNPFDADATVYTIGTSRFHIDTYDRARRFPGVVWLHDVNLVGLHLEWARRVIAEQHLGRRPPRYSDEIDVMRATLRDAYGVAVPHEAWEAPLDHGTLVGAGLLLAGPLVRGATHVVVNSETARGMLLDDLARGRGEAPPPIDVIPHAVPDRAMLHLPAAIERAARPGSTDDLPVIASFGIGDLKKRPEVILEAAARLDRPVQVAFVGQCVPSLDAHLRALAARLGIADRIVITGHVDFDVYGSWLARSAVAVQLRDVDFGESTGAVHDALAAGLPVVTSVRSCRDLPEGTVVNVAADIDAGALAAVLRSVLFDGEQRRALSDAATAYARSWSFASVAGALVDVLATTSIWPASGR